MRIKIVPKFISKYIDSNPIASKLELIGSRGVMPPYSSKRLSTGIISKLAIVIRYPKKIPQKGGRTTFIKGRRTTIYWELIIDQRWFREPESKMLIRKFPPKITEEPPAAAEEAASTAFAKSLSI